MFEKFIAVYRENDYGSLNENEKLAKHTTLRVGGPARVFVQPKDKQSFIETIKLVRSYDLSFKVLGKGSNVLVSDALFEGVIIKSDPGLDYVSINETVVTMGAGVSDVKVAREMAKAGLSGMEFLSGVPGTIGGAVYMNAGAYLKETKDILIKAQILDEFNQLRWLRRDELEMTYRTSILQRKPEWVVVEAVFQLEAGNPEESLALIRKRKEKRMTAQPLEMPSAGSTFRNPEGHAAWKLVDDANLRGFSVGGAMVSTKHTNFVVNNNDATAQNIMDVINHVKSQIWEKFDLEMHQEVEFFNW